MNVPRLRAVKAYILREPFTYNQHEWCGSACDIAGHAAVLAGIPANTKEYAKGKDAAKDVSAKAQEFLELSREEAFRLFIKWPREYGHELLDAITADTKANIAADRIEHFIATGGLE